MPNKKKKVFEYFYAKKINNFSSFYFSFASYVCKNPFLAAGKPRNESMICLLLMQVVILLKSCDGFPGGCQCYPKITPRCLPFCRDIFRRPYFAV